MNPAEETQHPVPADSSEARVARLLGDLIKVCRDGEEGYRFAAERVGDDAARDWLIHRSHQRAGFASALETLRIRHGGGREESGTLGGTLHRAWLGVRDWVSPAEISLVFDEIERGETSAIEAYRDILDDFPAGLYPTDAAVIEYQLREITRSREAVSSRRWSSAA